MNCGPREMVRSRPCEATLHQRRCLAGDRTQLVVRERESMQQGAGLLLGGWDEMACSGSGGALRPVSVESRRMTRRVGWRTATRARCPSVESSTAARRGQKHVLFLRNFQISHWSDERRCERAKPR